MQWILEVQPSKTMFTSYRKQCIDVQSESFNWCPYGRDTDRKWVNFYGVFDDYYK